MTIFQGKDIFDKLDYQLINIKQKQSPDSNSSSVFKQQMLVQAYFPVPKSFFTKKLSISDLLQQLSSNKTNSNPVMEAKALNAKNTKNDPSLGRYSKFSTPKSF